MAYPGRRNEGEALKGSKLQLLRVSRQAHGGAQDGHGVPRPRFNWVTRVAIPGLILGGVMLLLGLSMYADLAPLERVRVSPVVMKSVQSPAAGAVTVQAAGWVEADPYTSYVSALTDGTVSEVLVLEGEPVSKGQVVARLVDEDAQLAVQRARDRVKEAEAKLKTEQAELQAAKTVWENPVDRRRTIAVGKALLQESRATLKQVASEISMHEHKLADVKSRYDRALALHESKTVSEQEFIRVRSLYNAQVSQIESLKMRQLAVKGVIAKYEAELEAAERHMILRTEERRRLDSARAATLEAEAQLSHARTELAEAELRLRRMEIRAPMTGMVMSRLIAPGSTVVVLSDNPESARVLSLYDPKRLQVRVDVPLADAGHISVGQDAHITVEVLPSKTFSGKVTRVLHEANIQKNTLEVKVALTDPDSKIRPEMLARAKFLAKLESVDDDKAPTRVFAPEAAMRKSGNNTAAWVVREYDGRKGTAFSVPVQPGNTRMDGWIDVTQGLNPGDLVITGPVAELEDGATVHVDKD